MIEVARQISQDVPAAPGGSISTACFGPRSYPLENRAVGDFVSTGIWGDPGKITDYCSLAVFEGGKLVAGVLYYDFDEAAGIVQMSAYSASKRWLTRPVLKAIFELPFGSLGCQMVVLRVSERNTVMLRIARSIGFSEFFVPRLLGRDEGEFVFTLTDDQWRASKYNREAA